MQNEYRFSPIEFEFLSESFNKFPGGMSVHYQMFNEQSRKYFNRAYSASGTMFTITGFNATTHWQRIPDCFGVNGSKDEIMEFLKKADGRKLSTCCPWAAPGEIQLYWVPTIESENTPGAFLTQTPEEIFNSKKAPIMDTMFSFASQVFVWNHRIALRLSSYDSFVVAGNDILYARLG